MRKACEALRIDRSLYTYRSRRGEQAGLKQRIKEICETRVRYGYRRVHVLLLREGWPINMKRTRRLYNELGLQLRNKTPKRRVKAKLRDDRTEATRCNQTWAMDFVHDQLATGRKLRVLTIVDTWSRFSPAVDPRFSYRGEDVAATLERVCREHGYPWRKSVQPPLVTFTWPAMPIETLAWCSRRRGPSRSRARVIMRWQRSSNGSNFCSTSSSRRAT